MLKVAQPYLDVDPWVVRESGLHANRTKVSESMFSLANEFMGVRGYFEEGYGGESMGCAAPAVLVHLESSNERVGQCLRQ